MSAKIPLSGKKRGKKKKKTKRGEERERFHSANAKTETRRADQVSGQGKEEKGRKKPVPLKRPKKKEKPSVENHATNGKKQGAGGSAVCPATRKPGPFCPRLGGGKEAAQKFPSEIKLKHSHLSVE